MNLLIYYLAKSFVTLLQALPLTWAALFGRAVGGLVYFLDARHRRVVLRNLTMCFGAEKSPEEIHAIARENFKRIGENFVAAVNTLAMDSDVFHERVEMVGGGKLLAYAEKQPPTSIILAIGHFGNFEMFAQLSRGTPPHQRTTTYRSIKNPGVNRLLLEMRRSTGCVYFERRTEGAALRQALHSNNVILGLLADQHSGDHGVRLPFLGHECTTSKAPAIFALRFNAPLHTAFCYRTALARWRVEMGDEIPTHENGHPRSVEAIMLDVNRAFEVAVRRDPANWFWVHNRWKPAKLKTPATDRRAKEAKVEIGGKKDASPGDQQRLSGQY